MFVKPLTQASRVQSTFTEIVKVGTQGVRWRGLSPPGLVFPRQRGPRGQAAQRWESLFCNRNFLAYFLKWAVWPLCHEVKTMEALCMCAWVQVRLRGIGELSLCFVSQGDRCTLIFWGCVAPDCPPQKAEGARTLCFNRKQDGHNNKIFYIWQSSMRCFCTVRAWWFKTCWIIFDWDKINKITGLLELQKWEKRFEHVYL